MERFLGLETLSWQLFKGICIGRSSLVYSHADSNGLEPKREKDISGLCPGIVIDKDLRLMVGLGAICHNQKGVL